MKKNIIFSALMILATIALFMLKITKMPVHIGVSFVGLALLVALAILTRKTWKLPALEILSRVFYLIALITGIVLMNVHGVAAIAIIHKISAVLFAALLVVCEIHKAKK